MSVVAYEKRLDENRRWALMEGSLHFERGSAVFQTLERVARRLEEAGFQYAVVGGMAMFLHGYRRFTEDVDILVTSEGLRSLHERFDGHGYALDFSDCMNLRDCATGVRIEFVVTGRYPGDGRQKAIAFPDPSAVNESIDGIACLQLARLIELKLASGTAQGRLRDLADVQELIRTLDLPARFAGQLDPSVRDLFMKLWSELRPRTLDALGSRAGNGMIR